MAEETEDAVTETITEIPMTTTTEKVARGPRVKSNLLFNRRKPGAGRRKFAGKISSPLSTSPPVTTPTTEGTTNGEDVPTTLPTLKQEQEEETPKAKTGVASRFQGRRPYTGLTGLRPSLTGRTPVSITNSLLSRRFKGKKQKPTKETKEEEVAETLDVTTLPTPVTSTVFTAFGSSSSLSSTSISSVVPSSPTSSVEEELFGDEENIDNEIEPEQKPKQETKSLRKPFRKPQRKWPSVQKAKSSRANSNIRVEFKKASAVEEEEGRKPSFIKPDGRKPRVKANIRAR